MAELSHVKKLQHDLESDLDFRVENDLDDLDGLDSDGELEFMDDTDGPDSNGDKSLNDLNGEGDIVFNDTLEDLDSDCDIKVKENLLSLVQDIGNELEFNYSGEGSSSRKRKITLSGMTEYPNKKTNQQAQMIENKHLKETKILEAEICTLKAISQKMDKDKNLQTEAKTEINSLKAENMKLHNELSKMRDEVETKYQLETRNGLQPRDELDQSEELEKRDALEQNYEMEKGYNLTEANNNKETKTEMLEAVNQTVEVEKILGEKTVWGRGFEGVKLYLIKYKGYGTEENSWEPAENLNCEEIFAEYEAEKQVDESKEGEDNVKGEWKEPAPMNENLKVFETSSNEIENISLDAPARYNVKENPSIRMKYEIKLSNKINKLKGKLRTAKAKTKKYKTENKELKSKLAIQQAINANLKRENVPPTEANKNTKKEGKELREEGRQESAWSCRVLGYP